MSIRSVKDIVDAVDAGRVHSQRFFKNAGVIGDGVWHDWSYISGQPAYDARIGDAITLTPMIAAKNDAIYFPPKLPNQDRHLHSLEYVVSPIGTNQFQVEFAMYDLLAVYPLIDGDSTDIQELTNDLTLPRYANGDGVMAVLVNHVSPSIGRANITVDFVNSNDQLKQVVWNAPVYGVGNVCYALSGTGNNGAIYGSLTGGDRGVKSIQSVQFDVAPGGLWAIYLVKPLANFSHRVNASSSVTSEKQFITKNGMNMPKIEDGAWLGMFYMPQSGARASSIYGQATFVWG